MVALMAANGLEFPVMLLGTLMAGGVCAPVNPAIPAAELTAQLRTAGVRVLLATSAAVAVAVAAGRVSGVGVLAVHEGEIQEVVRPEWSAGHALDDARVAVLLPSSGTAGPPKNVMVTHRNLVVHALQCCVWGLTAEDVVVAVAPFSHSMGLSALLAHGLWSGTRLVTMPRFDLVAFLEIVQRHQVTALLLAPPAVRVLADDAMLDQYDLSSVQWVVSGAAALPIEVGQRCARRLKCPVTEAWGMSEAGLVAAAPAGSGRWGSVGPPAPGVEIAVVDPETGQGLEAGAVGEFLVRGPNVAAGYLGEPEASANAFGNDGWLRTGDVGWVDAAGYVNIIDRLKEMIKYKGFQVAPAELEALLRAHPAVLDAAVIPAPDDEAGELPKAFLVLDPAVDQVSAADDAVGAVAAQVAGYKRIRRVEVVDAVPRSPSGKLLRRLLVERERAAADAD